MRTRVYHAHSERRGQPSRLRRYYRPVEAEPTVIELQRKVRRSLQIYGLIGFTLFLFTGLTVAIATVPWMDVGRHGFDKWDALLGLSIASIKAGLVAAIFMHLNHERKLVYGLIALGAFNAIGLFVGTFWHFANEPRDVNFYRPAEHPMGVPSPAPNQAGW